MLEIFLGKNLILTKVSRRQQKHEKLPSMPLVTERMAAELQRMLDSDDEEEEDDMEESVFNTITLQMG